jgi:hypothetical protein
MRRLFDEPDELVAWAREALAAARGWRRSRADITAEESEARQVTPAPSNPGGDTSAEFIGHFPAKDAY